MIATLVFLGAALAGSSVPGAAVVEAASDVRDVALDELPLFDGPDGRARTASLLLVWSWRESAWRADAVGDAGRSLGAMQTGAMWLRGHAPAEVLSDRKLGLRLGLEAMRELAAMCGSVKRGLYAYASGTCNGTARARALVANRCAVSGAC